MMSKTCLFSSFRYLLLNVYVNSILLFIPPLSFSGLPDSFLSQVLWISCDSWFSPDWGGGCQWTIPLCNSLLTLYFMRLSFHCQILQPFPALVSNGITHSWICLSRSSTMNPSLCRSIKAILFQIPNFWVWLENTYDSIAKHSFPN